MQIFCNKSFENASEYSYLGTIPTNRFAFHEEIRSRINSGNVLNSQVENCYNPVHFPKH
jgi:hypothetical protein